MTTGARFSRTALFLAFTAGVGLSGAVASAQPPPARPPAAQPRPPETPPVPAGPRPLSESLTGDAKAAYENGRILYGDGDYATALVEFERAYELSREGRLLWNIAVCEKNLRRYARVLTRLEAYKQLPSDQLTDQDRRDAAELEDAVKAFVTRVAIKVNEPGAEVFIDEAKVGVSPLPAAMLIDVGERRFRVTKPGFVPWTKTQPVSGAGEVVIDVQLVPEVHIGTLVVEAGPSDTIFLDGEQKGTGRWQGQLPSGPHTLKVTADGMITYQTEVTVEDGLTRTIPVELQPAEGGGVNKWIFIVGGGVLLAAGAVVGGILLAQPGDPATTPGTIQPGTVQLVWGGGR